jgi:integrase
MRTLSSPRPVAAPFVTTTSTHVRFKPGVKTAGLDESIRFHDLRHTCAAWLIDSGAHVRAIMEWLGHSSPSVTLGTYGHLFPSLTEKLVDGLQARWEALET